MYPSNCESHFFAIYDGVVLGSAKSGRTLGRPAPLAAATIGPLVSVCLMMGMVREVSPSSCTFRR